MPALDDHDRELIEAYKAAISPSHELAESNWEVIADLAEREREHEPRAHRPSRRLLWLGMAAAAVALVSYVELRSAVVHTDPGKALPVQSFDQAAVEPPSATDAPTSLGAGPTRALPKVHAEPAPPEPEPEPARESEPSDDPPSPEQAERSTAAKPRRRQVEGPVLDIRAELLLLERARAALADEDYPRVLSLAQRHGREHPQGSMREEVAMLRVVALCAAGPESRWRAAKTRFSQDFPGSPLLTHLRDDCFP